MCKCNGNSSSSQLCNVCAQLARWRRSNQSWLANSKAALAAGLKAKV